MTAKPLQAGDLDRTLSLFTLDTHRSDKGEIGQSESPFALNVYCRKRETGGSEEPVLDRETATGIVLFDIRYRTDLTPTMRLYCENVRYDIISIKEGAGRRQWTVIEAKTHD